MFKSIISANDRTRSSKGEPGTGTRTVLAGVLIMAFCGSASTLAVMWAPATADDVPEKKKVTESPARPPGEGLSATLKDLGKGLNEALKKSFNESFTEHEQTFFGQIIVPVAGPDNRRESGRYGAWLLGQDPATSRGDLAPISLTETHLDSYQPNGRWPLGAPRNLGISRLDNNTCMVFARVHSPDRPPRVLLLSVVEQRSAIDKEVVHLYQVRMEYELTNQLFVRKFHRVTEIK